MKSTEQIRSSSLSVIKNNTAKRVLLKNLCDEYVSICNLYIQLFWFTHELNNLDNIKTIKLGSFYPTTLKLESDTFLSGRTLKCCQTQAYGIIKAALKKQAKRLFMVDKLKSEGKSTEYLEKFIVKQNISMPFVNSNSGCELNSLNISLSDSSIKHFELAFELKSLFTKEYIKEQELKDNKLILLCNKHRHYNKLQSKSSGVKTSFLVTGKTIDVRFVLPVKKQSRATDTLAIDQGINHCITSVNGSTGEVSQSAACNHKHTLKSIIDTMTKRVRGSKGFAKAQTHRTNYVNWSINQLNLTDVKELRLEKINDYGRGKSLPYHLRYFPVREIEQKLQDVCLLNDVHLVMQSSAYRSQRCSNCGFVHKSNRVAESFECGKCMFTENSDVNAAMNHLADLAPLGIKIGMQERKLGFYWLTSGVSTVPNETY